MIMQADTPALSAGLMEMADIDRLLGIAKRAKANDQIRQLDNQIAAVELTIRNLQAEQQTIQSEVNKFYQQKTTFQSKFNELESLQDFIEDKNLLASAKKSLEEYILGSEMEIEHFSGKGEELKKQLITENDSISKLRADRAKFPAVTLIPADKDLDSDDENENESQDVDNQLKYAVKQSGLLKKTQDKRFAIYGGSGGRASAQSLKSFLVSALALRKLDWYERSSDVEQMIKSIKAGGINGVIVFTQMSGHAPNLYKACKAYGVPLAMCTSVGKKIVLNEVCKQFNVNLL